MMVQQFVLLWQVTAVASLSLHQHHFRYHQSAHQLGGDRSQQHFYQNDTGSFKTRMTMDTLISRRRFRSFSTGCRSRDIYPNLSPQCWTRRRRILRQTTFRHETPSFSLRASPSSIQQNQRQGAGGDALTDTTAISGPPLLQLEGVTCSHDGGTTYQLQNVNYLLQAGNKIGLLGKNGCGKSTLMRIIAQEMETSGSSSNNSSIKFDGRVIRLQKKGCRVACVEQEPPSPSDVTVAAALVGIDSLQQEGEQASAGKRDTATKNSLSPYEAARRYKLAEIRLTAAAETTTDHPHLEEEFRKASELMEDTNGWYILTNKVPEMASRLKISHLLDVPLNQLSGGERKRVALAAALISEPDILLLDEPTNHLDLNAIRWMTDLLTTTSDKMTCLIVTHDRAFLNDVCQDGILELDRGRLFSYEGGGGYETYLEKKQERLALEDAAYRANKSKYQIELDWMRRQPQARETKSKARIDAFYKLQSAMKPSSDQSLSSLSKIDGKGSQRLGATVLECKGLSLAFSSSKHNRRDTDETDETKEQETPIKNHRKGSRVILDDFTYDFNRGDRIGIVGPNGIGKTTFLKVLTGQQVPDKGTIKKGDTVVFGIYDQMGIQLTKEEEDLRVLDFVKERVTLAASKGGTSVSVAEAPGEAMRLLKKFEFPASRFQDRVAMLSGGERRRLQLLTLLTKRPNFLILDEPTNDLDVDTLGALESYLTEEYKGVLLLVSHDRYFTDKVTDHLFVLEGNGIIKDYQGTLSDYSEALAELEINHSSGSSSTADSFGTTNGEMTPSLSPEDEKKLRVEKRNKLQKYKRELNSLEPAIERLKNDLTKKESELEEQNNIPGVGWSILAELTDAINALQEDIDEKEMRWIELAELLEQEGTLV